MDAFQLTKYYWNRIYLHHGSFFRKSDGYLAARLSFSVPVMMPIRYNRITGKQRRGFDLFGFWNETRMLNCLKEINSSRPKKDSGLKRKVLERLEGDVILALKKVHRGRAIFRVEEIHEA